MATKGTKINVTAPAKPSASFQAPDEPHWHRLISETAYFIAEQRGFEGDNALGDWLEAEQRVRDQLQGGL